MNKPRSVGPVRPPSQLEQTTAQCEDHSQGHGPQRIVADGVQNQNPDADAGGALQVAFAGRWRLPGGPTASEFAIARIEIQIRGERRRCSCLLLVSGLVWPAPERLAA